MVFLTVYALFVTCTPQKSITVPLPSAPLSSCHCCMQYSPALPLLGALALIGFALHSIRLATAGQLPAQSAINGEEQQGPPHHLQVSIQGLGFRSCDRCFNGRRCSW